MSRSAQRNRWQFSGWIAGLGTGSGHRVVIGHWQESPYGVVTDVMVEDPAGRRTLYAPTRSWPSSSAPPTASTTSRSPSAGPAVRAGAGRCGQAPAGLVHDRPPHPACWLLWAMPAALARTPWWVGLLDLPRVGCCQGSAPVAAPATDVASGTVPRICTPSLPPTPRSLAVTWARCERCSRRSASASCPTGHPWSPHHHDRGCPPSRRVMSLDSPKRTCGMTPLRWSEAPSRPLGPAPFR